MFGKNKNKNCFIVSAVILVCFAFSPIQTRAGTDWTEKQKLLAQDGSANDHFGSCVSISGDNVLVGTFGANSAYIFKWDGTNWSQQAKLTPLDGYNGGSFGQAVSIYGDYAVVGSYGFYPTGMLGAAYVFKRDGTVWNQQAKLMASDPVDWGNFAGAVSISSDYIIVGADSSGRAYIFKLDGDSWSEQAQLFPWGDFYYFACSVAISGDYAIVGSQSNSAYIFKRNEANWNQQAKLTASDGDANDLFGNSVSISGDFVIVGAYIDNDYKGSAYIFKRDGTNWNQQAKLLVSDVAAGDYFGCSVSISGDYAIVGSQGNSAYIFKRNETTWSQQAKLTASDGDANDLFGYSVSISCDNIIAGAMGDDSYKGSAYIFKKFCPRADLNDDCKVDFADFATLADYWLYGTD